MQIAVFLFSSLVAIYKKDILLLFFCMTSFFDAINNYHANFLKATGQFNIYSTGYILKSVLYIILLSLSIFLFRFEKYYIYILLNMCSFFFLTLFFEFYYYRKRSIAIRINLKSQISLLKIGSIILVSNASLTFVGNAGRLIASHIYSSETFAQYGFQNSLLNLILLLTNAVGIVFYNTIAKKDDLYLLNMIKKISLLLGILSGISFFIMEIMVRFLMPKYISALNLLSITFIAIPYIMISKMLIANLYKTKTSEKIYLRDSLLYAIIAFLFIVTSHFIWPSLQTIACATTICYMAWFLYTTTIKFTYLRTSLSDLLILCSHAIVFFLSSKFSPLEGLLIYLIFISMIFIIKKEELKKLLKFLFDKK